MPLQWRLQVLEAQLQAGRAGIIRFEESDLYALTGPQRNAALDALVGGAPLPLLIAGDRVIYSGPLEIDAVREALNA